MGNNAIATLQNYIPEVYTLLVNIVLSMFLFGILTALSTVSMAYLIRRGIRQPSTALMLCSVLVLYASAAMQLGTIVAYSVGYSRLLNDAASAFSFTPSTSAEDTATRFGLDAKTESYIINVSLAMNVTIGDAIVWWRACVLWKKKTIITIGAVLITGTFGLGLMSIVHRSAQLGATFPHLLFLFDDAYGRVSGLASLLTNAAATSLIGCKAWEHRQILRAGLGASKRRWRTPGMRTLALLVESGLLYCALLTAAAAEVAVARSRSDLSSSARYLSVAGALLDGGCFVQVLAIYPTAVIAIIALDGSLIERTLVAATADSPSALDLPTHVLPSGTTLQSSDTSIMHVSGSPRAACAVSDSSLELCLQTLTRERDGINR